MKSPRFDARAAELKKIFQPRNMVKVWTEKVRHSMREQHLADPLDNLDFHSNRHIACQRLSARILSGDYQPSPSQRILSEKSKGLCRQIVIPSVEDALVLQCLSDALYAEIKGKAPTTKAFF
jgi:retron-type reverse transcriptase